MTTLKYQTVIIGGGVAGMAAATELHKSGSKVVLIEGNKKLGGQVNNWYKVFPNFRPASEIVNSLSTNLLKDKIPVLLETSITHIESNSGNYILKSNQGQVIEAETVLLATGFNTFDPSGKEEYGYGIYPNVLTSVELEQRLKTNTNGISPKRIALVHCVGSRDEKVNRLHCSKVCCVSAVKQAIELKEFYPNAEIICLYMDLRMYDNGFEELYRDAQLQHNIKFIRGRLSECALNIEKDLVLKIQDTLAGLPMKLTVDQLILMVGKEAHQLPQFDESIIIEKASHGFIKPADSHLNPNTTSQPGIFCCGTTSGPKTIQETISDARSASLAVSDYLNKK